MDYKEKYEMALEKANAAYKDEDKHLKATLERIFPELKESGDEKIRKELIEYFENCNIKHLDWIAWLEKQECLDEIVSRCRTSWYNEGKIAGMTEGLTDDEKYQQGWHDALEQKGEHKPAEWSEEDKDMIRYIGNAITCKESAKYLQEKGVDIIKAHRWLESLRPQSKWKPTEEQLKQLGKYCPDNTALTALYEYLKQL